MYYVIINIYRVSQKNSAILVFKSIDYYSSVTLTNARTSLPLKEKMKIIYLYSKSKLKDSFIPSTIKTAMHNNSSSNPSNNDNYVIIGSFHCF